jgi:hypothetical protein
MHRWAATSVLFLGVAGLAACDDSGDAVTGEVAATTNAPKLTATVNRAHCGGKWTLSYDFRIWVASRPPASWSDGDRFEREGWIVFPDGVLTFVDADTGQLVPFEPLLELGPPCS